MNYDIPQALGVPSSSASTSSNNNSHRVSPHSYYQASHHLHQAHHRLKNEPFSPPISHSTSNTRSSLNDSNHSPSKPPVLQSQRSADYGGSPPCSEPSLKHARFDSSVWPNPTWKIVFAQTFANIRHHSLKKKKKREKKVWIPVYVYVCCSSSSSCSLHHSYIYIFFSSSSFGVSGITTIIIIIMMMFLFRTCAN